MMRSLTTDNLTATAGDVSGTNAPCVQLLACIKK